MKFSSSLAVAATTFSGLSAAWGVEDSWNGHPHKAPSRNVNATQIVSRSIDFHFVTQGLLTLK